MKMQCDIGGEGRGHFQQEREYGLYRKRLFAMRTAKTGSPRLNIILHKESGAGGFPVRPREVGYRLILKELEGVGFFWQASDLTARELVNENLKKKNETNTSHEVKKGVWGGGVW